MTRSNKHLVQVALIANIFQWYGFCVAAFLAATLGQVFFAQQSSIGAIIHAFAVFALSYLVRPLGSIFFGHIGDKYGSGVALKYSMAMMVIPTVFIGILPTYQSVGYFATTLLILLSVIQGIAAGGALPISASYVFEQAKGRPNSALLCSLANTGSLLGILMASVVVFILYLLFPQAAITNFTWRLPFIVSIPLAIMVLFFGHQVGRQKKMPVISNLAPGKTSYWSFIQAIVMMAFLQISFYLLFVWFPTYLEYFTHFSYVQARMSNMLALGLLAIFTMFFGYVGKFIPHKHMLLSSSILLTVIVYPLFLFIPQASFICILLIQCVFAVLFAVANGTYFFTLGSMFKSSSRNKAMAITFTIPTAVFGGSAPLICSYVIHRFHILAFPSFYIIFFGLLAIPAIITL